ncbi:hypothetical protein ACS0TY_004896 [Phlomoides rotata]
MESAISPQSREIKLHSGEETPDLVEEIIFNEILPKLPVKSLLKFSIFFNLRVEKQGEAYMGRREYTISQTYLFEPIQEHQLWKLLCVM